MNDSVTSGLSERDHRRLGDLAARFRQLAGRAPTFVTRAPGRVNLLGEHTDYNGLPVLPMAIDRAVLIAGAPTATPTVTLYNTAPHFPPRYFDLADTIAPNAVGDWSNYVKAAAQGLVNCPGIGLRRGAELLVDGDIPPGAGLSSSAALVVGSALALLTANDAQVPYPTLAELLALAERYVGTMSGGMDQATSLLAQVGHALRIDFFPLRTRTVPLPHRHTFVVCHSLVRAEKAGLARDAYNQRVVECRLAGRVLSTYLAASLPGPLTHLGDLVERFPARRLHEFVSVLVDDLPDKPMTLADLAKRLGTTADRLRVDCAIPAGVASEFTVARRARHVLAEADRVTEAEHALRCGDAARFGALMDASHQSCRDDYDISCGALEDLVRQAKAAGALGARLTGAGFGGCTVNLVPSSRVTDFLEAMDQTFYRTRLARSERPEDWRFVFAPEAGATVVTL